MSEYQDKVDQVGTSSYPIITIERGDMLVTEISEQEGLAEAYDVDVEVHACPTQSTTPGIGTIV